VIVRIWRGWTRREDAAAYRAYMTRTALPDYADIDGNLAVYLTSRQDGEREEFAMITLWASLDAIRAFAGDDPTRAVFYPDDDHFLVDREWTVTHYDVYGGRQQQRMDPVALGHLAADDEVQDVRRDPG
jgi:heme-degrading monooxygenase HmoA